MNSRFAAMVPYLKCIKLAGMALALIFLANLSWGQFASDGCEKLRCTMYAVHHANANAADNAHDCCPKRGKVPMPSDPTCCKYPCYTQAVTPVPVLLGDAAIRVVLEQVSLPRQRYHERLVMGFSPPKLRPPII